MLAVKIDSKIAVKIMLFIIIFNNCIGQKRSKISEKMKINLSCKIDNCINLKKMNSIEFIIENNSDQDVWIHAWFLRPNQIINSNGLIVQPFRLVEAKNPPIPEYVMSKKHSVKNYSYETDFFSNYRLDKINKYSLACSYEEIAQRKKDNDTPTFIKSILLPNINFVICD